jgi:multidrug efflux pump subunit AcrB
MREQGLLPADVEIRRVNDQAVFIRHALDNAAQAAGMGALLAMLVVYLFLGDLRRTLVVGTAIPLALLVTFLLMKLTGLTLNLMTLGGLALGVGILVDSTIVMLENIKRHRRRGEPDLEAAIRAAQEVTSPIVASTTTNLAAVLPFLFISGLTGLLFRELIFTLAAAIAASMVVALTLVPSLAARIHERPPGRLRRLAERVLEALQGAYGGLTRRLLQVPWLAPLVLVPALGWAVYALDAADFVFLPQVDEGQALIRLKGDPGMDLERMDRVAAALEERLLRRPEVETLFSQVGSWVYGRTQWLSSNRASIAVQLVPRGRRDVDTATWVERVLAEDIEPMAEPGIRITAAPGAACAASAWDAARTTSICASPAPSSRCWPGWAMPWSNASKTSTGCVTRDTPIRTSTRHWRSASIRPAPPAWASGPPTWPGRCASPWTAWWSPSSTAGTGDWTCACACPRAASRTWTSSTT